MGTPEYVRVCAPVYTDLADLPCGHQKGMYTYMYWACTGTYITMAIALRPRLRSSARERGNGVACRHLERISETGGGPFGLGTRWMECHRNRALAGDR